MVEKSRNRRKDDQQSKICWFSLCLVNFLYFLFSLCFSQQPNKSYVILISCFPLFWKKFFDVMFSVNECVAFSIDWWQWKWGESESQSNQRHKEKEREKTNKKINWSTIVTMHICTITVAIVHKCTILHPLMWVFFGPKCVKRLHFSILQNYPPVDIIALIDIW